MRIKEFKVHRYGPLSETGRIRLNNFNLFWGENEDGKTLTIEALIKLLVGKNRRFLKNIDRVPEEPDGYIILEDEGKNEKKIPEHGRLTDIFQITAEEFSNLFVIRNSDLTISRENEFYGNVTERLTGLRTNQLKNLKSKLRDIGGLTESFQIINTRESQFLKNRLSKAEELVEKIREIIKKSKSEKFDKLEGKLVYLRKDSKILDQEIGDLEGARLREKYEAGKLNLKKLTDFQEQVKLLDKFNEDELNEWRQCERIIEEKENETKEIKNRIKTIREEERNLEKVLEKEKTEQKVLESKITHIDDLLKPLLREHAEAAEKMAYADSSRKFFQSSLIVFTVIFTIFMAGVVWNPGLISYLTGGISVLLLMIFGLLYFFRYIRAASWLEQLKLKIFSQSGNFGIAGDGIPEIQIRIQDIEDKLLRQKEKVMSAENRIEINRHTSEELQQKRLAELEDRRQKAIEVIHKIKIEKNVKEMKEYEKKLHEKMNLERMAAEASSVLKNNFDSQGKTLDEQTKFWEGQVDELQDYKQVAKGVNFNERELEKKKENYNNIMQEIESVRSQLEEFRNQFSLIEKETNDTLLSENGPFLCQNILDLEIVSENLKSFIQNVEDKQKHVRIALEIFSEIEKEEEEKVSHLFGKDSAVSTHFKEITNSLYESIYYQPQDSGLQVKRRDGVSLSPESLSGGAYDQLYFAIRLALGETLLGGKSGFLILDDPFIKADTTRLKRQVDMLVDICRKGWQILYFSAKDEVLQALHEYVEKKEITLLQVPKSYFKTMST
jgi:DNA repair exonuclease SbcCD ATPase subunit